MSKIIVGIDVGGTTTDAVALKNGKILRIVSVSASDPVAAANGAFGKLLHEAKLSLSDISGIAATGGGARLVKALMGRKVTHIGEITAIGTGGLSITGKKQALVVSMGTGTALVSAGETIEHIGGTGVGGGTLRGLEKLLLKKESIESLEKIARKGNLKRVDLTVGDIVHGSVGKLPASATASNFGKVTDATTDADVALGILNLAGQVIASIAILSALPKGLETDIVLVGKVTRNKTLLSSMHSVAKLFGARLAVPKNADYCAAIGAARAVSTVG